MNSKNFSVSIIIPNYNGTKLFKKYLPAVYEAAQGAEVIVVDDASTDDSVAYLKQNFPKVKVIEHSTNKRFAAACNSGVAAATGDIIVLLNSDVEPTKNFLAPLLEPFMDEKVFAVGCAEINPFENKKEVSGRAGGAFQRGLVTHWKCFDQNKNTTLWVSGGSGAFRKSIWEKLEGMDTLFQPAYEEDRDICYRALKRGYKILFAPNSLVYHNHETTNKTALGLKKMQLASYKNHLLLVWKNITQPKLFIQHLLWLPYHLILTSIRTNGLFLQSFFWALQSLPQVIAKRAIEAREGVIKDEAILAQSFD